MRVQSVQTNYNTLNFKSWRREVYTKSANYLPQELHHRNDTWFFRDSEFWAQLTHFLTQKYQNVSKVNVYSYGCSDGSEPFTFVMRMLGMYGKDIAQKYFPIIAKDYDESAITRAKLRKNYFIENTEKEDINYYTNGNYKRFITDVEKTEDGYMVEINPEIYDNVIFKVADINKDYKKIKPNNSVVLARNFWPYIPNWFDRQKLLHKIGHQLGTNSYLVIGEFDKRGSDWKIENQIYEAGFKPTPISFVYEKEKKIDFSLRSLF